MMNLHYFPAIQKKNKTIKNRFRRKSSKI